jgi:cell division protein FtsW
MVTRKTSSGSLPDSITMVVILLIGFGTVFVFSAAANLSQTIDLQKFYEDLRLRQIIFFPIAILLMFTFSHFKYQNLSFEKGPLKSPVIYLLVLSIAVVALVSSQRFFASLPNIIPPINQHYRWLKIPLGPVTISFQPSELAKWTLIIFLAAFCCKYSDRIRLYFKGFAALCIIIALVVGLVILEDFGTAAFIALLSFCILLIAGVKLWHILTLVPPGICAFSLALIASPHRLRRIQAFLNPQDYSDTVGYQANQSLIAISSGGLWGKGLGRGISKYGHLPEDTTDFIFAIIGELCRLSVRDFIICDFHMAWDFGGYPL